MKSQFNLTIKTILPLIVVGLVAASCSESERTEAQVKENQDKYTPAQWEFYGGMKPIFENAEFLKSCVDAKVLSKDLLNEYNSQRKRFLAEVKKEVPVNADVALDSEAIAIKQSSSKTTKPTEAECNQANESLKRFYTAF